MNTSYVMLTFQVVAYVMLLLNLFLLFKAHPVKKERVKLRSEDRRGERSSIQNKFYGQWEARTEKAYLKYFKELGLTKVPSKGKASVTWDVSENGDLSMTDRTIEIGSKFHEHLSHFKPLCINRKSKTIFLFEGNSSCIGFNRSQTHLKNRCKTMAASSRHESLLPFEKDELDENGENKLFKPKSWLNKNADNIYWFRGITIFQYLDRSCSNIAHYAGKIFFLQHIMKNILAYSHPRNRYPSNILIFPSDEIISRFTSPQKFNYYHVHLLESILAPYNYSIADNASELMKAKTDEVYRNFPTVQVLKESSLLNDEIQFGNDTKSRDFMCFTHAITPTFLKGRFFINDEEYPSNRSSMESRIHPSVSIPRDSLRLRHLVRNFVNKNEDKGSVESTPSRTKQILLLDRGGKRRKFEDESRQKVLEMIQRVAKEKSYQFDVTSFENKTFIEQVNVMENVSIAIGVHGANLVNTIFMQPLSVLIELFPYKFQHVLYENGGNSGLRYTSYKMKTGTPFKDVGMYDSEEQCIQTSPKCKVHYRDLELMVKDDDLSELEDILRKSIDWHDELLTRH